MKVGDIFLFNCIYYVLYVVKIIEKTVEHPV